MSLSDPLTYFHLKPIRAARVSEISEATAAAPIPEEERVNFHIGNPLQDSRNSSAFLRIALGLDIHHEGLDDSNPEPILEALGWESIDGPKLEFLIQLIKKSTPYMPRGGYSRQHPQAVIKAFCSWLEHQQEPLHYDTGEQSARREIILASGGIHEILRIILFVISSYLEITPARILCYHCELKPPLKTIPNLHIEDLSSDERVMPEQIENIFNQIPDAPTFLLIGGLLKEETRRKLRLLSIERPLFFIEVNDAPNHLSLAREAKLVQRVIRLLTPAIFAPRLQTLSPVFIAGNADFLNVIENVHFQLKGTPSASEFEFLNYLLEQNLTQLPMGAPTEVPHVKPSFDGLGLGISAESALPQITERIERQLEQLLNDHTHLLTRSLMPLEEITDEFARDIQNRWVPGSYDDFSNIEANDLLDLLVQNIHNQDWCQRLQRSFLGNFIKHQPQYQSDACMVASGSSRTALGILGFHCGITEAVIQDLSWSYEQCFPKVHAVPLTASLELDVDAIIEKVEELCRQDTAWPERGAVVINNPHNATGRIFDEVAIRKLITYCLQQNLYLIDDLAYQNLAPVENLPEIKTAHQIVADLVHQGVLGEVQTTRLITVHTISKTDCLAGARLAVVEIRDRQLRLRFEDINSSIQPNLAAIFIGYLFYRGSTQAVRTFRHLRNAIFFERTQALMMAVGNLPAERNPFNLTIIPPMGSMYPLLHIERLPAGLSLDWLASSLARRGTGMLPLATFARTEKGFETGRTTFRLTLGGVDNADIILAKTRRLLIDLNRLIAEEEARYNRKKLSIQRLTNRSSRSSELSHSWNRITGQMTDQFENNASMQRLMTLPPLDSKHLQRDFLKRYLPVRLEISRIRILDRALISDELMWQALNDRGEWLHERLDQEFNKDSLQRRQELFRFRSYDRTVHPTQAFSLQAEISLDAIVAGLVSRQPITDSIIKKAANELLQEYLGKNVSITSKDESDEILLDLNTLTTAETYSQLFTDTSLTTFLSFWSDWDGSNRVVCTSPSTP